MNLNRNLNQRLVINTSGSKKKKVISTTFAVAAILTLSGTAMSTVASAATPNAQPSTRPSIAGGPAGQNGQGGPSDEGSAADTARHAAFQKFQDCLTATGVKFPEGGFGFPRGGIGTNGARPTGAPTSRPTNMPTARPSQPALTAEQQAALAKCASLRPQFGGAGGRGFGNHNGGQDDTGTLKPGAGTIIKKSPAPTATLTGKAKGSMTGMTGTAGKGMTNKTSAPPSAAQGAPKGAGVAYIACLNKAGVNVKSVSDVSKLDQGSPKIAAALKSCAGKK